MTEPEPQTGIADTGDVVDPAAEDPDPEPITDPDHPDYVEPYAGATPCRDEDDG